ncbi:uncharacterized protein LOC126678417 [Mercurialis annua]|uniref:uncharacterized protein LOC126678417 n=1 Tax=Mercurialis annua TaxID=3986 RepID=UPI00215E0BFA|nr:uncharacterized protein LOC126678417 [Mercurialis annua]
MDANDLLYDFCVEAKESSGVGRIWLLLAEAERLDTPFKHSHLWASIVYATFGPSGLYLQHRKPFNCQLPLYRRAQSAFVPGRKIGDNVLLAHELVHNYHRNSGKQDCAMKIDLRKAYDFIHWDCVEEIMIGLRFPDLFIKWVMVCIRSPWSLSVNCDRDFDYHSGCKALKIKHICFADDLFIFCKGNMRSIRKIANVLKHFYEVTRLKMINHKSSIYFYGVEDRKKNEIVNELSFSEGTLPVKYLGVPLINKRMSKDDCHGLIEKFTRRINHWTARHLTYVSRLQLINAVLFSIHVYWCSLIILPISVIRGAEKICNHFLWKGSVDFKYGNLVAWKTICMRKDEGGLGIKDLILWNKVAVIRHIWDLLAVKDSLWSLWIIKNKLKMLSFWGITKPFVASWSWRNLVKLRDMIKGCFNYKLGEGNISFWYDPWLDGETVTEVFPEINPVDTDIHHNAKVSTYFSRGSWRLPMAMDEYLERAWNCIAAVIPQNI